MKAPRVDTGRQREDDGLVLRAVVLAMLFLVVQTVNAGQALSVLRIRVVLLDPQGNATPVPRHALLVSENPASATPRRVVTTLDGTVDVRLRPGNYTVESDQPVAFHGLVYQWTESVDIVANSDAVLELTAGNAEIQPVTSAGTSAAPPESDPSFLLPQWQDSVVVLWTPTTRASGFVVDARGLIVTSQRIVGAATSVEVQLSPEVKVAARVLAADQARDVAVLWIDPKVAGSVRPLTLDCAARPTAAVLEGQEIFAIGAPSRGSKALAEGTVSKVESGVLVADVRVAPGGEGGPVFDAAGVVIGVTSVEGENDEREPRASRVVRTGAVCEAITAADTRMKGVPPPSGRLLPVEPAQPFPIASLKAAAERRAGSLAPYQISSSEFDIAFITPVMTYGAEFQLEQLRKRSSDSRSPDDRRVLVRPLLEFGTWSRYVADFPPVLLVRVTPKLAESLWATIARGAAMTQGMSLPPIKRFKPGFARMRAFCGSVEVMPIHPFTLERRVSDTDAINEGLYVFDPGALGPHCGAVKLVLFSEKAPNREDARMVDPKVIQQVWQDFAPYRER